MVTTTCFHNPLSGRRLSRVFKRSSTLYLHFPSCSERHINNKMGTCSNSVLIRCREPRLRSAWPAEEPAVSTHSSVDQDGHHAWQRLRQTVLVTNSRMSFSSVRFPQVNPKSCWGVFFFLGMAFQPSQEFALGIPWFSLRRKRHRKFARHKLAGAFTPFLTQLVHHADHGDCRLTL